VPEIRGLGDAEIDHLDDPVRRDEHVRRQALGERQPVVSAVARDGEPRHVLHGEVGPSLAGGAGFVHLSDVGMVHPRQGPALGLEALARPGVEQARADELESDPALRGTAPLGQVDDAHAPFSKLLDDMVGANLIRQSLRGPDLRQHRRRQDFLGAAFDLQQGVTQECLTPSRLELHRGFDNVFDSGPPGSPHTYSP
jgi:hypothetical protein